MSSSKAYYFRRYMKKYVEAGGTFEELAPERITEADVRNTSPSTPSGGGRRASP
jgi:hypothetical protein